MRGLKVRRSISASQARTLLTMIPLHGQLMLPFRAVLYTLAMDTLALGRHWNCLRAVNVFVTPPTSHALAHGAFDTLESLSIPWLYPLCCQDYSVSMIVSRSTSFTENFVICCYQITKISRSGHDCTSAPSARSPRNFVSQADTISVLPEVSKDTMLSRYHFCSRL